MPDSAPPVPRGRHAPPLEVRLARQRARLFAAAAAVFARVGYAEASAEAISREAGMSKATFYEHFANKEECILALFDAAAAGVRDAVATATQTAELPETRVRQGVLAFLSAIVAFPDHARTPWRTRWSGSSAVPTAAVTASRTPSAAASKSPRMHSSLLAKCS